jgi:hypothetical protein
VAREKTPSAKGKKVKIFKTDRKTFYISVSYFTKYSKDIYFCKTLQQIVENYVVTKHKTA